MALTHLSALACTVRDRKVNRPAMTPRFFSEEIEVLFEAEPLLEKRPGVPDGFIWRGRRYRIIELLQEWHDYRKRGRTAAFYQKERGAYWVKASEGHGSWGVGRDHFRVRTHTGEVFDIYYDRSPRRRRRKGFWVLWRQVEGENGLR